MKTKFCPRCKTEKPVDEFYVTPQQSGGRSSYCKQCRKECSKLYYQAYSRRIKVEVLTHYGSGKLACVRCGFADLRALSIDHIDGRGRAHKHKLGQTGIFFYRWLKKGGFPPGYQTLCMNCQFIKRVENKEYGRYK